MPYDYDLFVIGGGSGGVRCARIAAGHGARVAVAEERHWGGTCVNVGCVPKKLLVQAAEYGRHAEDARGFGWTQAQAGPHDWASLIAAKNHEISRLNGVYRSMLNGAGVAMFDARATFLDAHTLDVGGTRVTAERIVIAVGGMPMVQPPIEGRELGIVSDDAFFLPTLPRRIAIVGGGYIGMEFAGVFAGLGAEVDMVFRQHLPLRGFDLDLREGIAEAYQAQGIRLHPSQTVHKVEADGGARAMTLTSGHRIEADLVFFAVGRKPHTAGLGLERAGVRTEAGGAIKVDSQNRTVRDNIYAIGDVTDRLNLTPVAIAEGHSLADRLFGPASPRSWVMDPVATAVFSAPPIGTVGLTEEEAARNGPADIYLTRFTPMRHVMTGRPRRTLMKLVVDQPSQRVVGAHMLGDDAPEIMQGLAVAMIAGATKQEFDRTIGIHPTSAEEFVTLRTRTRVAGLAQAAE